MLPIPPLFQTIPRSSPRAATVHRNHQCKQSCCRPLATQYNAGLLDDCTFCGILGLFDKWTVLVKNAVLQPLPSDSSPLHAMRTVCDSCQLRRITACSHSGFAVSASALWCHFSSSFPETYISVEFICSQGLFPPGISSCSFYTCFLSSGKCNPHIYL